MPKKPLDKDYIERFKSIPVLADTAVEKDTRGAMNKILGALPPTKRAGKKEGGEMKKKSFPDLTGDGKVTMKDILKGRGVIKKKGGMMKKADGGLIRMHKQMAMSTKKFT